MIVLVFVFTMTSCSKDDTDSNNADVTEAEAVDAIESSLAKETNGLAKTVETTSETADDTSIECGQLYNDSYSENYDNGNYSYSYAVSRDYELTCTTEGSPDILAYQLNFNGMYETPRMSSDDSTTVNWLISDLGATETSSNFNGSYLREGTQISKVRNMNTFESTISYTLSNLVVNKNTYQILSGSAQVSFVGISSTGNQYNFTGLLTFNGDNTATLVLNGNTYVINL